MAEATPQDIKEITRGGGIRSRKLWAFFIVLAISFPLVWFDKIGGEEIVLLLGLYLVYCAGNIASKQVLTGGGFSKLLGLLTSTKKENGE